jgi:hypothetical protein
VRENCPGANRAWVADQAVPPDDDHKRPQNQQSKTGPEGRLPVQQTFERNSGKYSREGPSEIQDQHFAPAVAVSPQPFLQRQLGYIV